MKKTKMIICPECNGIGGFMAGHNSVDSVDCYTCSGKGKIIAPKVISKPPKINQSQQLKLIEGLTILFDDGVETLSRAKKILDDIYMVAHLNGTCENEHLDWHLKALQLGKVLKKFGIVDFDKS